jgi:hypothetical protein
MDFNDILYCWLLVNTFQFWFKIEQQKWALYMKSCMEITRRGIPILPWLPWLILIHWFLHYSVFQQNWWLRPTPITSTVAWKEIKAGGWRGNEANMEHTLVQNVALRNIGFQWMLIVLLNVFSCKESNTHEYCILIHELSYTNPRLSSLSEKKVTTLRMEQVRTCNKAVWLPMVLSRGFWTHWATAVYQQTSIALIGLSQRAELNSAANSTEKHYNMFNLVNHGYYG